MTNQDANLKPTGWLFHGRVDMIFVRLAAYYHNIFFLPAILAVVGKSEVLV